MIDVRPVANIIGLIVASCGIAMAAPMMVDLLYGTGNWTTFAISGGMTFLVGFCTTLSTRNAVGGGLTVRQTFILTTGVFAVLPVFGAIPFMLSPPYLSFTDAFFEAMSGFTTTGSTVIADLDVVPEGVLFWRGMLQWFGGVSIIVVALVFLPLLKVGGMQLFRWDSYDTLGTILPRAAEVTRSISLIYLALSAACALAYLLAGVDPFDAVVYSMTTVATGGFGNRNDSFESLGANAEMIAVIFMLLASLPFLRFHQMAQGDFRPLLRDSQIRAFLVLIAAIVGILSLWRIGADSVPAGTAIRECLFNGVAIMTGTGFASADYGSWGAFPVLVFFLIGMIGGCAGSTSCSIKVFRYQLLMAAIGARFQKIRMPNRIALARYQGQVVPDDVIRSVLAFFVLFGATLAIATTLLAMTGLDLVTSLSGAATAITNVGPGLGPTIGPAGNFSSLSDFAKWVLSFVMVAGRLELSAVYAILAIRFWQA